MTLEVRATCHRADQNQPLGGEIRAAEVNGVNNRQEPYDWQADDASSSPAVGLFLDRFGSAVGAASPAGEMAGFESRAGSPPEPPLAF